MIRRFLTGLLCFPLSSSAGRARRYWKYFAVLGKWVTIYCRAVYTGKILHSLFSWITGVNLPISCDSLTLWRSSRFNFCPTVNLFAYTSSRNSSNVSYFQLRPCHYEPHASNLIFRIVEHAFLSEKRMGLNAQDST